MKSSSVPHKKSFVHVKHDYSYLNWAGGTKLRKKRTVVVPDTAQCSSQQEDELVSSGVDFPFISITWLDLFSMLESSRIRGDGQGKVQQLVACSPVHALDVFRALGSAINPFSRRFSSNCEAVQYNNNKRVVAVVYSYSTARIFVSVPCPQMSAATVPAFYRRVEPTPVNAFRYLLQLNKPQPPWFLIQVASTTHRVRKC